MCDRMVAVTTADAELGTIASAESIEALEAAFARLVPLVREQLRSIAEHIHPEMRAAGMQVLRVAIREHRCSDDAAAAVGDIITQTGMDKSVVSRQLRQLAAWGLVTTRRSTKDGRVILVEATPLALERYESARATVRMANTRILTTWSEADVLELSRLLDRLVEDRTD